MRRRAQWIRLLACTFLISTGGVLHEAWSEPLLTGNAGRGEAIYTRCLACHALAYDRTGPRHCGLFGRKAGSVKGFVYSDAMKNSKIVWTEETLNVFLKNPMADIPGTAMGYAGIPDPQERADLIAYLKRENESATCANVK
ncbi:c-type cytochrome [Paralcaligenes ginsengisoli]